MHPPGPEKGKAGTLETPGFLEIPNSDDADNLAKTDDGRNLKPLPPLPPGYGFDEHNRPVPIVEPPSFTPEEKERLDVILPAMRWAIGSTARLAALEFLGRLDERKTLREIACYHKISPSAAHRAVRELRAFLEALR